MHRINEYLESPEVTALAETTRANYGYSLKSLQTYCVRNLISELGPGFPIQAFMDDLLTQVTAQSARQYLTVIKMFFKHIGHPLDYAFKTPSAQKKAQKIKRLERWFSDEEIELCRNHEFPKHKFRLQRTRNRALVGLLIDTGARISEICAIKAEHVNFEKRIVHLGVSKTQPRAGFFSEHTEQFLRKMEMAMGLWFSDTIFLPADTSKRIVIDMLKDLKIHKPGRGPHTFRHWVANHLYFDKGMDLLDVAFLLGDSPEVIRKTYLHPTPAQMQKRLKGAMAA
jgi:integrase